MNKPKAIKLMIVDDHRVVREGIKLILNNQTDAGFEVQEAEDGESAINKYKKFKPDITLMDINMNGVDGIQATKEILSIDDSAKIIVLSMHNDDYRINRVLEAGASGYLLKNTGVEELIKAITTVLEGQQYFSNEVSLKLMGQFSRHIVQKHNTENESFNKISNREIEVLNMIANEMTNEEIAKELNISKRTVDSHRQSMLLKLGLKNTAGLIRYAILHNLID